MLSNKYTIILLICIFFSNCTPNRLVKKSDNDIVYNERHSNVSDFNWTLKDNDYEDLNNSENTDYYNKTKKLNIESNKKPKNIENANFKNENPQIKSKKKYTHNTKIEHSKPITAKSIESKSLKKSKNAVNKNLNQENTIGYNQKKPVFSWPIKSVYCTKRDGLDGVRPIGIIITGKPSSIVLASADGIVTKVGRMRGFGNYIILKHINKYLSIYSNLKEINVNEGDIIKKGNSIGRLDGSKLHFQIGHFGKPENPLKYLPKEG